MRLPCMRWLGVTVLATACSQPSNTRTYELDDLPVTEWTAGLPVNGDGRLVTKLLPPEPIDWSRVTGSAVFTCDGCTLGDDETPLRISSWITDAPDGIYFSHLTFDTVRARADFAEGRVRFTSQWHSSEVVLDAEVHGELAPRAADTRLDGCVVFRPLDALLRRDPRMHALLSMTGASTDEHGDFTIKLEGTLGDMRRFAKPCSVERSER